GAGAAAQCLAQCAASERQATGTQPLRSAGHAIALPKAPLGFGRPHKAHDPPLWRPTHDGPAGRVVGALQDSFGWHDEPCLADQGLVMVALDAVFGSAAIRN